MPNVFYSLVRKKDNIENTEIITADAWLMDQEGNVFVEIEDYSIKKYILMNLKTGIKA